MKNKVSIIPPDDYGIVTLEDSVPDFPYVKKLAFVRNLPYLEELVINFSLKYEPADFTLIGIDTFNGVNGSVTIPANSSFVVIYICSFEPEDFLINLVSSESYNYLINTKQNNLTLSTQNNKDPVYSWLELGDANDFDDFGYIRSGQIKLDNLYELESFNVNGEVGSSPVSIKLNEEEFVIVYFTEEYLKMFKYSLPDLSLLLSSEYLIPDIDNLNPFLNVQVLSDNKFMLFYHSDTPNNTGNWTINMSYRNDSKLYYQIFTSNLEPETEIVEAVVSEDLCDKPPYNCNTNVDTSCVKLFTAAWRECNLEEFPLIDTSNGVSFGQTWSFCGLLTSFPQINTSKGKTFSGTWWGCSNLEEFPLLDLSSGINFRGAWSGCSSLTTFPELDVSNGINFQAAWSGCSSLTTFPPLDVSSGTNFSFTWFECSSLTTFPLLDVSSGTNFFATWSGCSSLTTFPLLDVSSGTNFSGTWRNCTSLTTFPSLDVSSGTNFQDSWRRCSSLTTFPLLDVSNGTNFFATWAGCESLTTFPAEMFDNCEANSFLFAWQNCALTEQSVDNILVSLDTAGREGGIVTISGGTNSPPGAAGLAAQANLISRGWTVSTN